MNTELSTDEALLALLARIRLKNATEIRKRKYLQNSVIATFVVPIPYVCEFVVTIKVLITDDIVGIERIIFRYREDIYIMERATLYGTEFPWEKDIRPMLNKIEFSENIGFHSGVRIADAARTIMNIRGDDL